MCFVKDVYVCLGFSALMSESHTVESLYVTKSTIGYLYPRQHE